MKKLFILFFFCLSYITIEAQDKNFTIKSDDSSDFNKSEPSSIKEKKPVNLDATAILFTESNNTSVGEKHTITNYGNSKENTGIRRTVTVDAVEFSNFSNDEKLRTPIYSEGVEKEGQASKMQHISIIVNAMPVTNK